MNFAAAHRVFMLSAPAIDADVAAMGAWIRLQSYCTSDGVETAKLTGAKAWKDRDWIARAQVSLSEVEHVVTSRLATWSGDDLVVEGYDFAGAKKVKTLRNNGKFGHLGPKKRSLRVQKNNPMGNPLGNPKGTPLPIPYPSDPFPREEEKKTSPLARSFADEAAAPDDMFLSLVPPDRISPSQPPVLVFPCNGTPKTWALTQGNIKTWEGLFPGVDIDRECKAALAWVLANRKKTAKGMMKFLTGWLGRSNDRGYRKSANGSNGTASTTRIDGIMARASAAGPELDSD